MGRRRDTALLTRTDEPAGRKSRFGSRSRRARCCAAARLAAHACSSMCRVRPRIGMAQSCKHAASPGYAAQALFSRVQGRWWVHGIMGPVIWPCRDGGWQIGGFEVLRSSFSTGLL